MRIPRALLVVLTGGLAAAAGGCATAYQDARMLPRGQSEVTVAVGPTFASVNGNTGHVVTAVGVHALFGTTDRLNMGLGYVRMQSATGDGGVNLIAFGGKVGLVPSRLAVALPLSFAVGNGAETSESFEFHPTALFTIPASPDVDVNPYVGALIPRCRGCVSVMRFGVGFGIRGRGGRFTLRPDVGVIVHPGDPGAFWTIGVGFSFRSRS